MLEAASYLIKVMNVVAKVMAVGTGDEFQLKGKHSIKESGFIAIKYPEVKPH